jgi:hypothetical protein
MIINDSYKKLTKIGTGSYGDVFAVIKKDSES